MVMSHATATQESHDFNRGRCQTTEVKVSDDGNTVKIINTHVPVAPPKEEPKQEETVTPAAPAPVVEIKTEPTTTVIETPNKQTGISFMDGLFG